MPPRIISQFSTRVVDDIPFNCTVLHAGGVMQLVVSCDALRRDPEGVLREAAEHLAAALSDQSTRLSAAS